MRAGSAPQTFFSASSSCTATVRGGAWWWTSAPVPRSYTSTCTTLATATPVGKVVAAVVACWTRTIRPSSPLAGGGTSSVMGKGAPSVRSTTTAWAVAPGGRVDQDDLAAAAGVRGGDEGGQAGGVEADGGGHGGGQHQRRAGGAWSGRGGGGCGR